MRSTYQTSTSKNESACCREVQACSSQKIKKIHQGGQHKPPGSWTRDHITDNERNRDALEWFNAELQHGMDQRDMVATVLRGQAMSKGSNSAVHGPKIEKRSHRIGT